MIGEHPESMWIGLKLHGNCVQGFLVVSESENLCVRGLALCSREASAFDKLGMVWIKMEACWQSDVGKLA